MELKIFDKSKAYNKGAKDISYVSIGGVKGILTSQIAISCQSEYKTLIESLGEFGDALQTIGTVGFGKSIATTGVITRKFFKGGGYLQMEIEMRIMDWDGKKETAVISQVQKLYGLAVPQGGGGGKNSPIKWNNGLVGAITSDPKGFINQFMTDFIAGTPSPITVDLSNYCTISDVGITNVNAKFSKEMTVNGPLFADITCGITSLQVKNSGELSGVLHIPNGNRIGYK